MFEFIDKPADGPGRRVLVVWNWWTRALLPCFTVKPGQAYPQDPIDEFTIGRFNPLVVVDFRFVYAFLHA